jgi:hypothetical protein
MRNILKNRKALSTVVTTLIILVVSVLLAGVVTYYAINVTSTRVQEESLNLTHQHVWHNATVAQAALMITNTGGRDVVIQKIAIRGQECDWTSVYYNINTTAPTSDFTFSNVVANKTGSPSTIKVGSFTYKKATTNIVLPSSQTLLIYIKSPDSISVNDIGLTVAISVFSAQAIYYKETNIQAAS